MFLPTQSWSLRVKLEDSGVFERLWVHLGHLSQGMVWRGVAWGGRMREEAGRAPGLGTSSAQARLELWDANLEPGLGAKVQPCPWVPSSTVPLRVALLIPAPQEPSVTLHSSLTLSPPCPSLPSLFLLVPSSPLPSFVMGSNPGHQARLPHLVASPV